MGGQVCSEPGRSTSAGLQFGFSMVQVARIQQTNRGRGRLDLRTPGEYRARFGQPECRIHGIRALRLAIICFERRLRSRCCATAQANPTQCHVFATHYISRSTFESLGEHKMSRSLRRWAKVSRIRFIRRSLPGQGAVDLTEARIIFHKSQIGDWLWRLAD